MSTAEQGTGLSPAARAVLDRVDLEYDGFTERWIRKVVVVYRAAGAEWTAAPEGRACSAGAGGRGRVGSKGCGLPAIVTVEQERAGKAYRKFRCELHSGGRLVADDGRVIEPVSNPLAWIA